MHVFAAKKNIEFLLFCDFIAPIYKKKKKTEINRIKFKRGCLEEIN